MARLPSPNVTENMAGRAGFQHTCRTVTPDTVVFRHTETKKNYVKA
jgi:hypothetical protein